MIFFGNHDTFFQDSFQVQKNSNFVCILHILHIAKLIGFHKSWTPLETGFTWKALFLGKIKSRRFQGRYSYGTLCTDGQMFFIDAQDVLWIMSNHSGEHDLQVLNKLKEFVQFECCCQIK